MMTKINLQNKQKGGVFSRLFCILDLFVVKFFLGMKMLFFV